MLFLIAYLFDAPLHALSDITYAKTALETVCRMSDLDVFEPVLDKRCSSFLDTEGIKLFKQTVLQKYASFD